MCGICGIAGHITFDHAPVLTKMNKAIIRRGPDESGEYLGKGIGLAMRRLSILDLEGGTQPIFNENRDVCTIFNGEIYNYLKLRDDLQSKGHSFSTNSDTEVIVHLYEEYGVEFPKYLRGMFAIALWDINKQKLVIVRDRIGIKPLYYSFQNNLLLFGSELKCIIASERMKFSLDLQAIDAFLTFMYIPAPYSIYQEVKKLEPGHILILEDSKLTLQKYWDLDFLKSKPGDSQTFEKQTKDVINDAIKSHLVSDVPVGSFLSGGVDSGIVSAVASQNLTYPLQTFTVGFKGKSSHIDDERPYARELVKMYGFTENELECNPSFEEIVDEILDAFDEPFADDSVIPNYYVCALAAKKVKVVLSGLGGDELFAGYRRYNGIEFASKFNFIPEPILRVIRKIVALIPEQKKWR